MSSGYSGKQDHDKCNAHAAALRFDHDIRASIALTKGFNKALESSLSELSHALHQALAQHAADPHGEPVKLINVLEEDCRFCVLRISRSLEQLDARLNADARFGPQATSHVRPNEP